MHRDYRRLISGTNQTRTDWFGESRPLVGGVYTRIPTRSHSTRLMSHRPEVGTRRRADLCSCALRAAHWERWRRRRRDGAAVMSPLRPSQDAGREGGGCPGWSRVVSVRQSLPRDPEVTGRGWRRVRSEGWLIGRQSMATVVMVINQRDDGDFPRRRRVPVTDWLAEKQPTRLDCVTASQRLKAARFIGART